MVLEICLKKFAHLYYLMLHQKMADQTGQNTVPYVYVNGEFIGGYKSLKELEESGKLYIVEQGAEFK